MTTEEKKLAWAFVQNKTRKGSSFDDCVEDKGILPFPNFPQIGGLRFLGRGMIILMVEPPGIGKTFAAEASKCIKPPSRNTGLNQLRCR